MDDYFFVWDGVGGEGEFVVGVVLGGFVVVGDVDGCLVVGDGFVDCLWGLVVVYEGWFVWVVFGVGGFVVVEGVVVVVVG